MTVKTIESLDFASLRPIRQRPLVLVVQVPVVPFGHFPVTTAPATTAWSWSSTKIRTCARHPVLSSALVSSRSPTCTVGGGGGGGALPTGPRNRSIENDPPAPRFGSPATFTKGRTAIESIADRTGSSRTTWTFAIKR